jgi:hypothetical protein
VTFAALPAIPFLLGLLGGFVLIFAMFVLQDFGIKRGWW